MSNPKTNDTPMKTVPFGDECEIQIPEKSIDCSKMGFFDELEYDCWDLIKKYCERFGIEIKSGDISFDIAKGIQDHIIGQFQRDGVVFSFGEDADETTTLILNKEEKMAVGGLLDKALCSYQDEKTADLLSGIYNRMFPEEAEYVAQLLADEDELEM